MFPWKGGNCSDGGIRGSSGVFAGNSAKGRGYWRPTANTQDSLVASTNTKQASCRQHLMTGYFAKDITRQKLKQEHLTEQVHASIALCTPGTSEEDKLSQLTADCDWNCSWSKTLGPHAPHWFLVRLAIPAPRRKHPAGPEGQGFPIETTSLFLSPTIVFNGCLEMSQWWWNLTFSFCSVPII